MIWARPASDLEASTGPAWQADHIEAVTRAVEYGIVSRRFDVAQAIDPRFLDKTAG